ncbi:MAG: prenyltransferase/squalene oxidase repeat-containing protein [Patescibacteria group bacterium]|nr:prenyltransferase/squalene oxidase repeat-containing protein [Patescibacteria group bacterium]
MLMLSRRRFLQSTAMALASAPLFGDDAAMALTPRVVRYLEGLRKPDGGYGWSEQDDSYLTETYAAIGALRLLEEEVPNPEAAEAFIRDGHPTLGPKRETRQHWADPKEFTYQQIQALLWLGRPADDFAGLVESWRTVSKYAAAYERRENPVLRFEAQPPLCRRLLGLPREPIGRAFRPYFAARRRDNGSYNTTLTADGGDGHLVNTYHALAALQAMGDEPDRGVVAWIQDCQLTDGGFSWQPNAPLGNVSDLSYALAAARILALFGQRPKDAPGLAAWLQSLLNADGGFGDRPDAPSSALATFQVLETCRLLGVVLSAEQTAPPRVEAAIPAELRAYAIQFEAPGMGSTMDAVEIARNEGIHLWGAKNASAAWIRDAQRRADEQGVPVTFFVSNEEYGTSVSVPGLGDFTHVNDPIYPAETALSPWSRRGGDWRQFWDEKLVPTEAAGGRMLWQICDHECFGRVLLDESVLRARRGEPGGYAAISAFHFHCWNMAFATPYVMRYRHELPLIALQDAHGPPWFWRKELRSYRTLFLAAQPTWDGWLSALKNGWVVAVRQDARTHGNLRMLGGSPEVRRAFEQRREQWLPLASAEPQ